MSSSVLKNVIQPKSQTISVISPTDEQRAVGPLNSPSDHESRSESEISQAMGVLVENAPVAMAMFDRAMRYVLANRSWIREFGLQHVQPLVGRSQYEIFPNLHPGWRQVYERALQGHIVRSEHDADGRNIVYRWEVRPWRKLGDATVAGLMVTCEKFATGLGQVSTDEEKDALKAQEQHFAHPDPFDCNLAMLILDEHGVIQRTNATASHLTLDKGLVEGQTKLWEAFNTPSESSTLRDQWAQLLATSGLDESAQPLITRRAGDTGSTRWLVSPVRTGKSAVEVAGKSFLLVALPSALKDAEPPSVSGVSAAPPAFYPPAPEVAVPVVAAVSPEVIQKLENELSRTKQELRTMMEAERGFVKRETRLRSFLEGVPCGIFVLDERGATIYQNERLAKLLGRAIEKGAGVEAWLVHGCPTQEHREHVTLVWRESVWRRQLTRTISLATADGLLKEIEFQPVTLSSGGMLVSIQDVTENCRHEEQLRGMEAKMRTLLQSNPSAIVLTDKTGVIFEVNQQAELLLGQPKSELRRFPLDAWLDPDSATARRDALRVLRGQGAQPEALGVQIKRADGTFAAAILHLAVVPDAQGEPHCTIHFFQNPPEESVDDAEAVSTVPVQVSASVQAVAPVPVTQKITGELLSTDANGRIASWSEHAEQLFDFDAATALGRPLHLLFRPSDATGFFTALAEQSATPDQFFEHSYFGAEGRGTMPVCVTPRDGGGFVLHTQREITIMPEPEQAEMAAQPATTAESAEATSSSRVIRIGGAKAFQVVSPSSHRWPVVDLAREKLMLSETHHRIKNHLQIISSLLNMQINGVSDQHARDALRSSQNRVRAIAALHQHLYQLALGGGGTFSDFTRGLIQHLRECYEVPQEQIAVGLSIQEGAIDPEWLMPLALTMNEALSNSFEHAFPHSRAGSITATLSYSGDIGELLIRDDGVGLPVDFNPADSPGLGLKILAVFAEQMRGQLFIQGSPDQGTEVKLRFPTGSVPETGHAT